MASVIAVLSVAYQIDGNVAFADPGQSTLTVTTFDSGGNQINGYYTILSQNGVILDTGFSPARFTVNNCDHETNPQNFKDPNNPCSYSVTVSDYGQYVFDHWQLPDGSTVSGSSQSAIVMVGTTSTDTALTAVYRNINDVGGNNEQPPLEDTEQPSGEPIASGQSTVTVRTIDSSSGGEIFGYYAILSQSGAVVGTGFSPVDFTLDNGQAYTASVSDYGSYYFNYWQDTENTDRERTFTVNGNAVLTAVYSTDPSGLPSSDNNGEQEPTPVEEEPNPDTAPEEDPNPAGGQSSLTVRTADTSADNEITGYWTVLSQNDAAIATGFSPATFTLDNGLDYTVSVSDYGDFVFDHWDDTGSTTIERAISINADTEITAIFQNINGDSNINDADNDGNNDIDNQQLIPEETEQPVDNTSEPASSGQSTITVSTEDLAGNAIAGYYATLSQGSAVADSRFSPADFTVNNGQTYLMSVSDYGDFAFSHWKDTGSESRERSISVTEDSHFTAVYENINGDTTDSSNNNPEQDPEEPEQPTSPPDTDGSITVHAYRIPSVWWGPTFAEAGANMYFVLYNSSNFATGQDSGFADENGYAFSGLDSGEAYYVLPTDCEACHGSNHNVIFRHWEDGSTERLRSAIAGSANAGAYFEYVPWT